MTGENEGMQGQQQQRTVYSVVLFSPQISGKEEVQALLMHSDTLLIIASSKDRYILSISNCMHYRCTEVRYALVFEKQRRLSLGVNYRYSRGVLMSVVCIGDI